MTWPVSISQQETDGISPMGIKKGVGQVKDEHFNWKSSELKLYTTSSEVIMCSTTLVKNNSFKLRCPANVFSDKRK